MPRLVTHDDLTEVQSVLDAADELLEAIADLRERLKTKEDVERAVRLRLASDSVEEAKRRVEGLWK